MAITAELKEQSDTLSKEGMKANDSGDFGTARQLLENSLAIRRSIDDKQGIANAIGNLGIVALCEGSLDLARNVLGEALLLQRELNNQQAASIVLCNLSGVAYRQGDFNGMHSLQEEMLSIQRELGNQQGVASALDGLTYTAVERGDYQQAEMLQSESLRIKQTLGIPPAILYSVEYFAEISFLQRKTFKAIKLYAAVRALRASVMPDLQNQANEHDDKNLNQMRDMLDKNEYEMAYNEGTILTLEQAIEYALEC